MSFDMKNIASYYQLYCNNDRLYDSVLRKHFGNRTPTIRDKLIESGYFKKATMLRCPECDYAMFDTAQEFAGDYLREKELYCNACDNLIKTIQLIPEPVLIRTNKVYENLQDDNLYLSLLKWEYKYNYGKVCKDLNKIQKEMFEQKLKEPDRNVKFYITLSNGEKILIDKPVEFTACELESEINF